MFTNGGKEIAHNQMHVRIPNSCIKRNQWVNLCIDLDSFTRECFSAAKMQSHSKNTNSNQNLSNLNISRGTRGSHYEDRTRSRGAELAEGRSSLGGIT